MHESCYEPSDEDPEKSFDDRLCCESCLILETRRRQLALCLSVPSRTTRRSRCRVHALKSERRRLTQSQNGPHCQPLVCHSARWSFTIASRVRFSGRTSRGQRHGMHSPVFRLPARFFVCKPIGRPMVAVSSQNHLPRNSSERRTWLIVADEPVFAGFITRKAICL